MAVRTYAQLISDISTYLVAKVRITQHSALVTNIVDTIFNQGNGSGARPYKVYSALLTQTSTNAPVAIILENTLGGTVVWDYIGVGQYTGTLAGAFISNKTWLNISVSNVGIFMSMYYNNVNSVFIQTQDIGTNDTNGLLNNTAIEIRVYNT